MIDQGFEGSSFDRSYNEAMSSPGEPPLYLPLAEMLDHVSRVVKVAAVLNGACLVLKRDSRVLPLFYTTLVTCSHVSETALNVSNVSASAAPGSLLQM